MRSRIFSVKELIDSFHMDEFLKVQDDLDNDNAAVLLITDSQMVLSYTGNQCKGSHADTIANILCEINGIVKNEDDFEMISDKANEKYIVGKFINMFGLHYLFFELHGLERISFRQLELFQMFMEQYNDDIKSFSHEVESPTVYLGIYDNKYYYEDLDLRRVYSYLESITDKNIVLEEDPYILGESHYKK